MRILAIDPGYGRMGVAVLEPDTVLFSDCLTTRAGLPFESRLAELGADIERLLAAWHPEALALEKLFFSRNQKTAMQVSELRGMLLYLAGIRGLAVREYSPVEVKTAVTGYGKADKRQISTAVRLLVKIPKDPKLDDEFDAIAIGLTDLAHVSHISIHSSSTPRLQKFPVPST